LARIEGTLSDEGVLREALAGCDLVVHLAAECITAPTGAERMWQTNALGTSRFARLAREANVGCFVHFSSALTVGGSKRPAIRDERSPFNLGRHRHHYANSKLAGEDAVLAQAEQGLHAVVLNPATMFIPEQPENGGTLLATAAARGLRFSPPGGINVVDVRDVVQGCLKAIELGRPGERYLLGGSNVLSRELVHALAHLCGRRPPRFDLPAVAVRFAAVAARLIEVVKPLPPPLSSQFLRLWPLFFWTSSAKAERELGYLPGRQAANGGGDESWLAEEIDRLGRRLAPLATR
jgi:dihydroflavonol-4-reductase